jgi:hypothetical protein
VTASLLPDDALPPNPIEQATRSNCFAASAFCLLKDYFLVPHLLTTILLFPTVLPVY